jgi:sterol desaturase/sphingolipid hydroxylase (fatty acid hydroxylase superfamily)
VFFLLQLVIGNHVFAFLPGFVIAYSLYHFVHYAVHAYRPPKSFLKVLWINHGIHHFKDDTVAFGVSSPLWDVIMGTLPKKTCKRKFKTTHKQDEGEDSITRELRTSDLH